MKPFEMQVKEGAAETSEEFYQVYERSLLLFLRERGLLDREELERCLTKMEKGT